MRDRTKTPKAIPELTNHAYLYAQQLFIAGRIPVAQAVGMMLSDRAFVAECDLAGHGHNRSLYAECIVRDQWARKLLEASRSDLYLYVCWAAGHKRGLVYADDIWRARKVYSYRVGVAEVDVIARRMQDTDDAFDRLTMDDVELLQALKAS